MSNHNSQLTLRTDSHASEIGALRGDGRKLQIELISVLFEATTTDNAKDCRQLECEGLYSDAVLPVPIKNILPPSSLYLF
jgi:hypothetical protein